MSAFGVQQVQQVIKFGLQPAVIIGSLWYFIANQDNPMAYPLVLIGVHLLLGIVEWRYPARPHWMKDAKTIVSNVLLVIILTIAIGAVGAFYGELLAPGLADLRQSMGADIWPHHWPIVVQILMVFFLSEFIWYWVHRAEHRWSIVWRVSGHGAHHSFKKLSALNFGLNHPLEFSFLVLPSALVELFFGVGGAAAAAAVLSVTQASIAHANIDLNTKVIGWVFTTNKYHLLHHSMVLEESNTNYGCSAIIWDRLFGTCSDVTVEEAGTGASEPTLWQKFIMPIKEPSDTAIAP